MAKNKTGSTTFTVTSDREIVITRMFDAPRELVFKAYTDPALIPKWWGSPTRVDKMDVSPGGVWRFVNRGQDGNEYAFNGVFREIVPPERLVQTFEFEGAPGHGLVQTMTFEDQGGKTKLTITALFQSVEDRDGMLKTGMERGAVEGLDRLAELLENLNQMQI